MPKCDTTNRSVRTPTRWIRTVAPASLCTDTLDRSREPAQWLYVTLASRFSPVIAFVVATQISVAPNSSATLIVSLRWHGTSTEPSCLQEASEV